MCVYVMQTIENAMQCFRSDREGETVRVMWCVCVRASECVCVSRETVKTQHIFQRMTEATRKSHGQQWSVRIDASSSSPMVSR